MRGLTEAAPKVRSEGWGVHSEAQVGEGEAEEAEAEEAEAEGEAGAAIRECSLDCVENGQ
jgi:hypothetical protein